jgi:hypothetical protein
MQPPDARARYGARKQSVATGSTRIRRDEPCPASTNCRHMTPTSPGSGRPPASIYDADYFSRGIHQRHWFRDNAAKYEMRWEAILRMLRPRASDRLLDVGCAAGEHAIRLAPLVAQVTGVDSAPAAIDKAMAIDFVEHIDDEARGRLQAALGRVLVPGGLFVISRPRSTHDVERLTIHESVLRQGDDHIAVRDRSQYGAMVARSAWRIVQDSTRPSIFAFFRLVDRALAFVSLVHFRIYLAFERRIKA